MNDHEDCQHDLTSPAMRAGYLEWTVLWALNPERQVGPQERLEQLQTAWEDYQARTPQ